MKPTTFLAAAGAYLLSIVLITVVICLMAMSASGQSIGLLPGGTYKLDSAGILRSTDLTQEFQIWDNPSQYEVRIIRSSRDTAMPKLAIYKSGLPLVVTWKNRIAVMGDTLQAVRALSWAILRLDSLRPDWQNRVLPVFPDSFQPPAISNLVSCCDTVLLIPPKPLRKSATFRIKSQKHHPR